jgi:SGNH hydrolase-like domain, acetyltransferase AlgX
VGPQAAGRGLYYFDVLGGAVALLISARLLALIRGPQSAWNPTTVTVVATFMIVLIALTAWRSKAYSQTLPWLVGVFSITAFVAIAVLFWPLHLIWFIAAMGVAGAALMFALVLRRKPWSESISRPEMFRLIAIAIGAFLGLVMIEVGLRIAPGIFGGEVRQQIAADPTKYGVAHPYIGYLHRPNGATIVSGRDFRAVHQVDPAGFRNPWPWPQQPQIVVVGDSVSFGYGVEGKDAWPAIVARALPRNPLVNLSLIGAGPQQYLRVYETFGAKLQPKLLLVGVFAANDFWDAEKFDLWLQSGAGGNYMVWRDFGQPGPLTLRISDPVASLKSIFSRSIYPVLRMSRTYNLLRALRGGSDGDLFGPPKVIVFKDGGRLELRGDWFRRQSDVSAPASHAFQLVADALIRLHALATEQGTHVLMVLQPGKEEVYLPQLEDHVPDITRALRDVFDSRGIEYLDLSPGYRERAKAGEQLFFEADGHPNQRGYALSGELVLNHLRANAARYGLAEGSQPAMKDLPAR